MSKYRRRHRKLTNKEKSKVTLVISIVALCISVFCFFMMRWENEKYATEGGESTVEIDPIFKDANTVTIDGVNYVQRDNIRSYLFMGVDTTGEFEEESDSGQADMQMLLVVDDANKTWRILEIDRDTMTTIDVYNVFGDYIGPSYTHILLAYTYGEKRTAEGGARNAVKAVSDLLWGQKINGYFAMNMDAIKILNDAVGGVPVVITTDFTEIDPDLVLGEEVVLQGDQAETFVRSRMKVDDGTNEARMRRQEVYMKALLKKIREMDSETMLDIYDKLINNSVTNMGSGDIVDLGEMMKEYTQLDNIQFEGEHKSVQETELRRHTQFIIDEDSLNEVILELFYEKA